MTSFKPNFVATSKYDGVTAHFWPPENTNSVSGALPVFSSPENSMKQARSTVRPWLADVAYSLSHNVLLPAYFNTLQINGYENLPQRDAIIFAPTHRSRWDALLVPYAIGPQVTGRYPNYMVTIDEMQGLQGWFIRRLGGFAINTRSPGVSSLRYGIELLHQKQSLVIFPEGGQLLQNRAAGVNRLHPGLARIAVKASLTQTDCHVHIVPMAINYSDPQVGRCDVDIQIGPALSVRDYLGMNGKCSAKLITRDLHAALWQLSGHAVPVMA